MKHLEIFQNAIDALEHLTYERDGRFYSGLQEDAEVTDSAGKAIKDLKNLMSLQSTCHWQPIETAPKDGTPIIISIIEDGMVYDVCNGHFEIVPEDEEDGPWDIRGGEPWCSYEGRPEGTYFCCWLPGKEWESRWRVTDMFEYNHWMPLPNAAITASPEEQANDRL